MTATPLMFRSLATGLAALAAGAVVLAAAIPLATAQQSERSDRNGQPRLADLMQGAQAGHIKLWFAGKSRNWELAAYETRQIKMRLIDAASLYQSLPVNDVTTMSKPLEAVAEAIQAKNERQFARAFDELTAGCNSCHQSVKLGYITMQQPAANPFSDQNFAPPRK